jgi:hypothetical protein
MLPTAGQWEDWLVSPLQEPTLRPSLKRFIASRT